MYSLLGKSFQIIVRKFPPRSFLRQPTVAEALSIYALTLVVSLVEIPFDRTTNASGDSLVAVVASSLAFQIAATVGVVYIGKAVINRYAHEKFSLKEMFTLDIVLTAGASIIGSILYPLSSLFGEMSVAVGGGVGLVFGIYMLLTFQAAISQIAGISKSEAAYVIIAPVAVLLLAWVVFLATIGGIAAFSG